MAGTSLSEPHVGKLAMAFICIFSLLMPFLSICFDSFLIQSDMPLLDCFSKPDSPCCAIVCTFCVIFYGLRLSSVMLALAQQYHVFVY